MEYLQAGSVVLLSLLSVVGYLVFDNFKDSLSTTHYEGSVVDKR